MKKLCTLLLVAAVCAAGVGFWYYQTNGNQGPHYRTARVERAPITASIAASGTIQPEEVIDVGAQVAGRIDRFGFDPRYSAARDALAFVAPCPAPGAALALAVARANPVKLIDYRSPVGENTILAQLDPSLYQARVDKAAADLQKAQADLLALQAKFRQSEREFGRAEALVSKKAYDLSSYDLARSDYETSRAYIEVNRAALAQARAALNEARTNLSYTTIRSPVKGVIIDRRVNVGQTVVASLNAPSLFLIAKDLKRMQIWASVNEADIGHIHTGQAVLFTVDAYAGVPFKGQVAQLRLNATMTQSVVTYTVVVDTDNSSGILLPYLTANLQFITGLKENALQVPNAALRWRPPTSQIAPDARAAFLKSQRKRPSLAAKGGAPSEGPRRERGVVWVADGNFVRPLHVTIGLTDGTNTEILSNEIQEHLEVVVGEARSDGGGGGNNPLIPNVFGGKKKE